MKPGVLAVPVVLLLAIVAVCALAADRPAATWEYGVYTELQLPHSTLTYAWEAKGGGISALQKAEVLRRLGYNVSDKADPPMVTLLNHLSSLGWELQQVVPEPGRYRCQYFFRRPAEGTQR